MNKNCPGCGGSYNITPQHVGRSFACQKCGANLVVQPSGLTIAGQPQHVATGPMGPQGGYDPFGGGGGDYSRPVVPHRPRGGPNPILDFLLFRTILTPILVQILFWVAVIGAEYEAVQMLTMAFRVINHGGVWLVLRVLLIMLLIPVAFRLLAEVLVTMVRYFDSVPQLLREVRDQHKQ